MALLTCADCGKEISDQAESCPSCGAPVNGHSRKKTKRQTHPFTWVALGLVIAGGIWFATSSSFQEQLLPEMPVEVRFRPSVLGQGLVIMVKNESNSDISAIVRITRLSTDKRSMFTLNLRPGDTQSIGHLEGWQLQSGDTIEIESEDYRTWQGSIP